MTDKNQGHLNSGPARARPGLFLLAAAACSIASAITTLGLIFLPDLFAPVPPGLEGRMLRIADPIFQLRSWIALLHPLLGLTAAAGVATILSQVRPSLARAGYWGFAVWALTEAAQQSMRIFAFDRWRAAWLSGDAAIRQNIDILITVYDGLFLASYVFLLAAFIVGNTLFAIICLGTPDRLARAIGAFFAAAALLSLLFLESEIGPDLLGPAASKWTYALTQPLARLLIGLWLIRHWRSRPVRRSLRPV